jgi:asparagine synthase (glutamine-hydrolysing)
MSGIGGVLRFDGRPVERRDLERMANALQPHGPDRAEVAVSGPLGLAHVLMRITPEDQFDRQPWRGPSGALIVADLRLDNRDDVLARLGVPPQDAMAWPDSRVVLAAWEKFGEATWPMLQGPFAVAIWNERQRTLTLARDQLGLNVVTWHKSGQLFAFATLPKGLFALADVPRELSEEKFADFLVLNHNDHASTIYRNVFRVPPATTMSVKADGAIAQRRYWSADDIKPVRLESDQAYAEGLRDALDKAVRRQMRSAHKIGFFLSGGLDSSAVTALGARALAEKGQRLAAFTQVPRAGFEAPAPRGRYNDETAYVEAIRELAGNIDVNYVRSGECDDFAELERFFLVLDGPVRNPINLGWALAIARLAREQGRRVLLGGQRGNYTISWSGWSQTAEHALRGRWLTTYRQLRQHYRSSLDSRWTTFRKLIVEPLAPERLGAWAAKRRKKYDAPWDEHAAIRSDFAAETGVLARAGSVGHDFLYRMRRNERRGGLTVVDYTGDWNAAEKALHGVEIRDPTADMGVVEYCFGVPPEQYLAEGIDRSLVRRAMWGLLPEAVLTNRLNGLQASDWFEKLEARRDQLASEIAELEGSPLVSKVVDLDRARRALADWPSGNWHTRRVYYEYALALPRAVAASRFLRWIEAANR